MHINGTLNPCASKQVPLHQITYLPSRRRPEREGLFEHMRDYANVDPEGGAAVTREQDRRGAE
jgi:hypothetical protein